MDIINDLVSIIVPCYNQGSYLSETLNSIMEQTYELWECIIIDDGSTDNTKDVAINYCTKDSRFKYKFQENHGVVAARNNAIQLSQGEYILPLDGDDLIASIFIEKAVRVMQRDNNIKLVYSDVEYIGDKEGMVSVPEYSLSMLLQANCFTNTSMYRRKDFNRIGGYNPNMQHGFEDWDFWISILEGTNDEAVYKLNFTGAYYRVVNSCNSRNKNAMKYREQMRRQIFINHAKTYYEEYTKQKKQYDEITQSFLYICYYRLRKVKCIINKWLTLSK